MRRKAHKCSISGCGSVPHLGGLCEVHARHRAEEERLHGDALNALHHAQIDGGPVSCTFLHECLMEIRHWWFKACDAINFGRPDPVLGNEAECAVQWCIAIAKEIVLAEQAYKNGIAPGYRFDDAIKRTRERFFNLEKGLMSNGHPRPLSITRR